MPLKSNSVAATTARRGLGYSKIRDSGGYLMRNELSLSLPSHQGTLGILSTDTTVLSHCCLSPYTTIWLALCFSRLQSWNTVWILWPTANVQCVCDLFLYFHQLLNFSPNRALVLHHEAPVDNGLWLKCSGQGFRKWTKLHVLESNSHIQEKKDK